MKCDGSVDGPWQSKGFCQGRGVRMMLVLVWPWGSTAGSSSSGFSFLLVLLSRPEVPATLQTRAERAAARAHPADLIRAINLIKAINPARSGELTAQLALGLRAVSRLWVGLASWGFQLNPFHQPSSSWVSCRDKHPLSSPGAAQDLPHQGRAGSRRQRGGHSPHTHRNLVLVQS